jgi:FkbM family methyltransferase
MNLRDLQAASERTLKALADSRSTVRADTHPYYGFYEADIFDCPPFLMFTSNDCPRAHDILYARSFEPQSMRLWCRLARGATGILDIGAHVGVYSLAAASLRRDIAIHAFEPNPHAFARLRVHKIINKFDHIVEHPVALGSSNDTVKFSWVKKRPPLIASGAGVGQRAGDSVEETVVPIVALDTQGIAATLGSKPLVKIDVEGGEKEAFKGMQQLLALKPDIILETFSVEACDAINEMIAPLGYNVFLIREAEGAIKHRSKVLAANLMAQKDYNQLLTTRSKQELWSLLA